MPLDDFNRANSNGLGANWTLRNHANNPGIASNAAVNVDLTGNAFCPATYNVPPPSDNQFAEARCAAASKNPSSVVLVRASTGGSAVIAMTDTTLIIATITGWTGAGYTSRASNATTFAIGDVIRLAAVGKTYTVYKNGISVLTWTDSGGVITPGPSRRLCGIGVQWGGAVASNALDDYNQGVIVPSTRSLNQAVFRSSLY